MAATNSYEKHYLTSRRAVTDDDKYVLVLFKSDNTFIIRKKSNLHGVDENGLVDIKDRGKTYTGYCLFEGNFFLSSMIIIIQILSRGNVFFIGSKDEIEAAAERLDKEMNTDLESDCEAIISISTTNQQQSRQNSTTTSTISWSKSNTETSGSSTTKSINTQKKDNGNLTKIYSSFVSKTFSLNLGTTQSKVQSLASANLDSKLKN